ncbi:MAG: hypothetical protein ABSG53_27275 [Thermoguttaceae bacterium]
MSRESRDGRMPHESDDDIQSSHSPGHDGQNDQNDQNEEQSQDESEDSGQLHRHDREHHSDHNRRSDVESFGQHEHHSHKKSSDDADRSTSDDADAETPRRHVPEGPVVRPPHSHHSHDRPRAHSQDQTDEQDGDRIADHSKFASYDDDADDDNTESSRSDAADYSQEPRHERSYRAEPAHRLHSGFRAGTPREAVVGQGPVVQQTAAPRRAIDASPYKAADPSVLTDPVPAYSGASLHPYEQHRTVLIGLSTALVGAIIAIVALMVNLSTHKDLAQSALKDRKTFEGTPPPSGSRAADARRDSAQVVRHADPAGQAGLGPWRYERCLAVARALSYRFGPAEALQFRLVLSVAGSP